MKAKTIIAIIAPLALLATCIGLSDDKANTKSEQSPETVIDETDTEDNQPESKWTYSTSIDEMTDKTSYLAWITSENSVDFNFPYDGGSELTLNIRESPQYGKNMYIAISKGQFNPGINGTKIMMRFDNNEPIHVNCSEPSDHSTDVLFLSNSTYSKILKMLKSSKTLKINAEFFNEGVRTFTFEIAGLEWDH